jgi:hypothetical protein
MRRTLVAPLLGLLGLAQSPQPPANTMPAVWVVSSLTRVLRGDTPLQLTTPHLYAARGEYEAFQIAVRAPTSGLTLQSAAASDLTNGAGGSLSGSNITLYREHYVQVTTSSPDRHGSNRSLGPGWYPDALIPFVNPNTGAPLTGGAYQAAPYTVDPAGTLAIWVDVWVAPGTSPGDYAGLVTLSTDQGNLSVPWTLTVWNFTLPLKSTLRSAFLYGNTSSLSEDEELLRNRIEPLREPSWEQSTLISSFGLGDVALPFWSGADTNNCTMSAAPSANQIQASVASQTAGLSPYIYSADEIGNCPSLFPTMQQWAQNVHQAGISNLVVIPPTPALYDDGTGTGRSAVDIWVVLPMQYNAASIAQVEAKGNEVWSYNALVQDGYSPKWLIDYDPIDYRIQAGFLSQSQGLTGVLYWRVDQWSPDPWNNVNNAGQFGSGNYPGEGLLVYPGQDVGLSGVVPSMRLKQLRDGIEDYEYVAILKSLGRGDWALGLAGSVAPDWKNWTRDANALEAVRRQLGGQIDALSKPTAAAAVPARKH